MNKMQTIPPEILLRIDAIQLMAKCGHMLTELSPDLKTLPDVMEYIRNNPVELDRKALVTVESTNSTLGFFIKGNFIVTSLHEDDQVYIKTHKEVVEGSVLYRDTVSKICIVKPKIKETRNQEFLSITSFIPKEGREYYDINHNILCDVVLLGGHRYITKLEKSLLVNTRGQVIGINGVGIYHSVRTMLEKKTDLVEPIYPIDIVPSTMKELIGIKQKYLNYPYHYTVVDSKHSFIQKDDIIHFKVPWETVLIEGITICCHSRKGFTTEKVKL